MGIAAAAAVSLSSVVAQRPAHAEPPGLPGPGGSLPLPFGAAPPAIGPTPRAPTGGPPPGGVGSATAETRVGEAARPADLTPFAPGAGLGAAGVPPPGSLGPPGTGAANALAFPLGGGMSGAAGAFAAPGPARAVTVTPSLGVEVAATDSLAEGRGGRRGGSRGGGGGSDLFLNLSPAVLVTAQAARVNGVLNYAPRARLHARSGDQDRLDQVFNGQALAALVPDALYLDLRGSGAVTSASGGFAPETTPALDRADRVQTTSFQVSPYAVRRFGGLATAQVGYALQRVDQGDGAGRLGGGGPADRDARSPFFRPQSYTAHEVYANARTGEDFGRLGLAARLGATAFDGTGVLDGARRASAAVGADYALTRSVAVLGEVGYEDQRYGGLPPVRIAGPTWSAGLRLAPTPESAVTARYGRRDGFESASLDGSVALGGRTRLAASYGETLTSSARRAGSSLTSFGLDAAGTPVDLATGAPSLLAEANPFLGVQSSLFRLRSARVSLSRRWTPRDAVTLALSREEQDPVSSPAGLPVAARRGASASVTWTRDIAPGTTGAAYLQYGRTETGAARLLGPAPPGSPAAPLPAALRAARSGDVVSAGLSLSREVGPGLVATLRYVGTVRDDGATFDGRGGDGRATRNLVVAGLRQTF